MAFEIKNKALRALVQEEVEDNSEDNGEPIVITAEDLDDTKYNPANDAYISMTKHLRTRMSARAALMRPSHLAIAKLAQTGIPTRDIALQTRTHPSTVRNVLKRAEVRDLRDCMDKYAGLLAGATEAMENSMLYRIAVRNEISDPKTAISAISELKKTRHNSKVHDLNAKQGGKASQTVVVQLTDPRLQPSQLDKAPAHLLKDIN